MHMDERMIYLRQSGFRRLWQAAKEKYERHGRVGGKVELSNLSMDEIEALSGLLAVNLYGQTSVVISLSKMDQALEQSKFSIGLAEVLGHLFPDMRTREERRAVASASWSAFCTRAKAGVDNQAVLHWIDGLSQADAPGYRTYLECYKQYEKTGDCSAWISVVSALGKSLSRHSVWRLPVFAAEVTGDPHGLDRDTLAGKMFYSGLVALTADTIIAESNLESDLELSSVANSKVDDDLDSADATGDAPAEHVRMVYMKAGIRLDDVSSIVWIGNWPSLFGAPIALPLMALENGVTEIPAVDSLYVVENPSVFAELIERLPAGIPVVCTSGQPSVAALRLLDMATATGTRLHYSGDFDVKGLQMAISLRKRYTDAFVAWHMDAVTYRFASDEKQPRFMGREVQMLKKLEVDWDDELIPTMMHVRRKVFQEHIISKLLSDFDR